MVARLALTVILLVLIIAVAIVIMRRLQDRDLYYSTGSLKSWRLPISGFRPSEPPSAHYESVVVLPRRTPSLIPEEELYSATTLDYSDTWVVMGQVPTQLVYWGFTLLKHDVQGVEPVGVSFNHLDFAQSSLNQPATHLVVLVSPSLYMAEWIATKISSSDFGHRTGLRVAFAYLPVTGWLPTTRYSLRLEAIAASGHPVTDSLEVRQYCNPTESATQQLDPPRHAPKLRTSVAQVDEHQLVNSTQELQVLSDLGFTEALELQPRVCARPDVTLLETSPLRLTAGTTLRILAWRHAAMGLAFASEIGVLDDLTNQIVTHQETSRYQVSLQAQSQFVVIEYTARSDCTLRVYERVYLDLHTKTAPEISRLLRSHVQINSSDEILDDA